MSSVEKVERWLSDGVVGLCSSGPQSVRKQLLLRSLLRPEKRLEEPFSTYSPPLAVAVRNEWGLNHAPSSWPVATTLALLC